MTMSDSKGAHRRVVENYFETTSQSSDQSEAALEASARGLQRGLDSWLDVAGCEVLDLGSGTGTLCWLAKRHGASRVVGVNLSQGEIEFAEQRVDAEFVNQDILAYLRAAPDASFDRIFALNILEHLDKDTLVAVLEESRRCLRPGGSLVAMVPNAISPFGGMTRYWDITHHNAFTPSSVWQLTRLSGFERAEFREWGPRAHGLKSAVRSLLWQGIRASISARLLIETGSAKGGVYTADMLFRLWK